MGNCFLGQGLQINGIVFLSPREALPFLEGEAVLVDLRLDREKSGREFKVKTVVRLPFPELTEKLSTLPRDRPLIFGDSVGVNSKEAARLLLERGYESVAVLNGGMIDWQRDRMPTFIDRDEELVGSCTCRPTIPPIVGDGPRGRHDCRRGVPRVGSLRQGSACWHPWRP